MSNPNQKSYRFTDGAGDREYLSIRMGRSRAMQLIQSLSSQLVHQEQEEIEVSVFGELLVNSDDDAIATPVNRTDC